MKPFNGIKGLWDYFVWERETRDLCHAGKDITHAVNDRLPTLKSDTIISFIQKGNFLDLTPDLQAPLKLRKQYWLDKQPKDLISKIESYPSVLEERFEQYKALGSPNGVFGVYVWLHSTIDIARSAFKSGILTQEQYQALDDKTQALIQKGTRYFQEETPKDSVAPGIYHDSILESSTRYVVRHLAHNLKNIFRIVERDQRTFFLEVFEKWDFRKHRIAVCVPISVGCPNRCHQCNFGVLIPYHRALTSDEIFSLVYTNAIINDDVTSLFFEPRELTIYYLGGGDPGNNIEEIEKVVQKMHQFCRTASARLVMGPRQR